MLVINIKLEIVIPHRIENIMKVRNNKDYLKGRHIHTLVCDKFWSGQQNVARSLYVKWWFNQLGNSKSHQCTNEIKYDTKGELIWRCLSMSYNIKLQMIDSKI